MRWVLTLITLFMLAGCGDGVEWFPDNDSGNASSSPDTFSFAQKTSTQASANNETPSQSDPVEIKGTNAAGWLVSVTDTTAGIKSEFLIIGKTGDTFSNTSRTILPNQSLQIQHLPSKTIGGKSETLVKVGEFTTTFATTTVANP